MFDVHPNFRRLPVWFKVDVPSWGCIRGGLALLCFRVCTVTWGPISLPWLAERRDVKGRFSGGDFTTRNPRVDRPLHGVAREGDPPPRLGHGFLIMYPQQTAYFLFASYVGVKSKFSASLSSY